MDKTIKREKERDWQKAINFIPKENQIIVYDCKNGDIKFKIGDGVTKVNDLNFVDDGSFTVADGSFIVKE